MKTVVPMRSQNSTLRNYNSNNSGLISEFEFPIGVGVSLLSWIVLAIYFGVIVLGVFAVVLVTGISIGSFRNSKQASLVQACVPATELQFTDKQERIRKAA